jgi:drug/metabolite transporter (DMT)-like permease
VRPGCVELHGERIGAAVGGAGSFAEIVAALRRPLPRDGRILITLAFVGITGGAMPWAGQAWAQQFLDSGLAAVLNSFTPVATLVMAVLMGQERLHRNRVLGLAVAIGGMITVVGGEVGAGKSVVALLVAVVATTGYALASVVTRSRISGRVPNLQAAALQLVAGAIAMVPLAWTTTGPPPTRLGPVVIGALAALGLLGTGLAFLVFFTLIERVGATNATMVTYLVPVVGLASGAIFRGERFGPNVFAGAILLIGGVWLSQKQPFYATAVPAPPTLER